MKKTGFYIIKDKFYEDMPDPYLKGNNAGNRTHYYCFEDTSTGIYWMIPLSSRIDKYRRIMEKKENGGFGWFYFGSKNLDWHKYKSIF